jgi:hypothetical protein
MEKETATEWLFKQLWDEPKDKFNWNAILSKANKMFEHEIVDAYANGHNDGCRYMDNLKQDFEHGEQYFNQTFKKD